VTRLLLRVVFAVLVTAVSLVAAEFALRYVFRHASTSGNAHDFVGQHGPAPAIRVNNLGFRDRDVPPKSDKYRIAVVGDSFAWGQGVEEGDRFSNLIEQALGPRYEVFNLGRPGNNMPEHLDVLTQALAIRPDFVLLQLYINDWETASMERPQPKPLLPERWNRALESRSILYDLLRNQWGTVQEKIGVSDSYAEYMARNLRDRTSPNARLAYGQLAEFFDRAEAAHVGVGAVLFPAPDALGKFGRDYPFGFLHEGTAQVCAEKRVPFLDLLPAYSRIEEPRTLWVSPFDAHPNAMSNKLAATEILQRFGPMWRPVTGT
jgi:GDSL-like lipase/acylhydrolase family protein